MLKTYAVRTWADPRLVVQDSPISGKGIFTNSPIKEGELLMVFGGQIVDRQDLDENKYRLQTAFPIDLDAFIVLPVSDTSDTVDEYLNHSCDPSAWLSDEVTVVARRDIRTGSEITLDVATWDMDTEWLYSDDGICYCNSPLCRKSLRPTDYQNPALQERYRGHFSPYIQKQIEELIS